MNKDKLVNGFIIGTFVSLYLLVSIISTIHVIDFFELSNPRWMAITLAIGFEIGAAASLASLIVMKKMNKTLVWALFITITAMQINGNLYYAFINMQDYTSWVELFNLMEWEPLAQKRLLAAVSGAILPLVALGFIKSLVDYIKPEDDEIELSDQKLDEIVSDINSTSEKKTNIVSQQDIDKIEVNDPVEVSVDEEWDEDHALDQVLNEMAEDLEESTESLEFSQQDTEAIIEAVENPPAPNEKLKQAAERYKQLQEDDFSDLDVALNDGLDELEDQIDEIETEEELDELEDEIEELEEEIEELEEEIEEDIDELTGITNQVKQPETRIVNQDNVNSKRFKKGPLWQYRTNYQDDDKFD